MTLSWRIIFAAPAGGINGVLTIGLN